MTHPDAAPQRWGITGGIASGKSYVCRLLEAQARGLWAADENRLQELRDAVLDVEGDLEEAMGDTHIGEHQGTAVDVITRSAVKEWTYTFTVKSS